VEGEYTEEAMLEIILIGQPPCEPREIASYGVLPLEISQCSPCVFRSIYGHIDFLGKGSTSLLEDVCRLLFWFRC